MTSADIVLVDGFKFRSGSEFEDGENRILDLDLGKVLGYGRPRVIRELIAKIFNDSEVCRVARQTSAVGGRPALEYWLTEEQAVVVIGRAETARATELSTMVAKVFVSARRGLLSPAASANHPATRYAIGNQEAEVRRILATAHIECLAIAKNAGLIPAHYAEREAQYTLAALAGKGKPDGPRLIDASEYLRGRGFKPEGGQLSMFGKRVAKFYRAKHGTDPVKSPKIIGGAERPANSYTEVDIDCFDKAFAELGWGPALPAESGTRLIDGVSSDDDDVAISH